MAPPVTPPRNTIPPPRVLASENEAHRMFGVSKPTFRKWVKLGLIHPVEMPFGERRNLYLISDIEDLAASFAARK